MAFFSINYLSNSSGSNFTVENLTFTGNQNITRYLRLPSNVSYIVNSYINISGFSISNPKLYINNIEVWNNSNTMNNIYYDNLSDDSINMTLWRLDSWAYGSNVFYNFSGENQSYIKIYAYSGGADNLDSLNLSTTDEFFKFNNVSDMANWKNISFTTYSDTGTFAVGGGSYSDIFFAGTNIFHCVDSCAGVYNNWSIDAPNSSYFRIWKNGILNQTISPPPNLSNPTITINTLSSNRLLTQTWISPITYQYSNDFINETNNTFQAIDDYISNCSYVNGYCYVPFIFHSDSAGILRYSNLIINNFAYTLNSLTSSFSDWVTNQTTFNINISYDNIENDYVEVDFWNNFSSSNMSYIKMNSQGTGTNRNFYLTLDLPNETSNYYYYYEIKQLNTNANVLSDSIEMEIVDDVPTPFQMGVQRINFGICNATYGLRFVNFTAYEQTGLTRVSPFNFKSTLRYFLGNGSTYRTLIVDNSSISELGFCTSQNLFLNPGSKIKITGLVEFSNSSYQTGNYWFNNYALNLTTQKIFFYFLNQSLSTSFIIKVQDTNQVALPNYFVYIYRYYPASDSSVLVQGLQTDNNGQGIGFFETETVYYSFIITDNFGNIVLTTPKDKIIPITTPYTLTFTIGQIIPSPYSYFGNLSGLTYTLGYNTGTKEASFVYSDSNSTFDYAYLKVSKQNYSGNNNVVCNISKNNNPASIICDLSNNSTGSYVAEAYIIRDGVEYKINSINFDISGLNAGMLGILGGFFIILICAFALAWNEVAGIIFINVGVIAVQLLGLINFGIIGISGIIGVSILILIILERG